MPKKPTKRPAARKKTALSSTADLRPDAANPRQIKKVAQRGLAASLKEFGDLSGIVFNRKTKELVAGHQRMDQIRSAYGERPIEVVDQVAGLHGIRIDADHFFPVRFVNWSVAKQRAANVAANNQKLQGEFTDDLANYLQNIEAELEAELPGLANQVLLGDLMQLVDEAEGAGGQIVEDVYQVVVDCEKELTQKIVYDLLVKHGYKPKLLTV